VIITSLTLIGYNRVLLNGLDKIVYKPNEKTQLILGQNGSGKSSLLNELTPLPANIKKDFREGGSKEICIEHNSNSYVLTSIGNKHSFLLNGNELNDGGTVTVQNTLVMQQFGISNQIHQVLLGNNSFTSMSPAERKKWVTSISTIDYSYPITTYNSLKQRHRDIVGGIKLLHANIARVKKSSIPEDVIDSLTIDKENYIILINHILTLLTREVVSSDIDNCISKLTKVVKIAQPSCHEFSIEEMRSNIKVCLSKKTAYEERLLELYKELERLKSTEAANNKPKLVSEIKDLNAKIASIINSNRLSKISDIDSTYAYMLEHYPDLIKTLSVLTENTGVNMTKANMVELVKTKSDCEAGLVNLDLQLAKTEENIKHAENHVNSGGVVECPECHHTWHPERSKLELTRLYKVLEQININKEQINKQLIATVNDIEGIEIIRDAVLEVTRKLSYTNDTKLILEYVKSSSGCGVGYEALFTSLENAWLELQELYAVVALTNKKQKIEAEVENLIQIASAEAGVITARMTKVTEAIHSIRKQVIKLDTDISHTKKCINVKTSYLESIKVVKDSLNKVYLAKKNNIEASRNIFLKKAVSELRIALLAIDEQLATNNEYSTMLTTYQNELNDLTHKEKLLKITLKELSPSEGLIAKSISSFLNCFLQSMNTIIASVWGYDMRILTCDLGVNDLDYKFRVLINNSETVEDISKTSSSMREIIDLAFRVSYAKFAGFIGYPLYLDEFARTFDANHRITAYQSLENNIANDFGQIFIVSHFTEIYGRFKNSDISILGTTGVEVSAIDNFNEVMTLT